MCTSSFCMKCGTPYRSGSMKYIFKVTARNVEEEIGYMCKDCYALFLFDIKKPVTEQRENKLEKRECRVDTRGRVTFTPAQRNDICNLYEKGYTIADISYTYGLEDLEKVKGVLYRAGYRRKPTDNVVTVKQEESIKEREPDIKDLGRVGAYMDAGWPPQKIANEFGVELITAKRAINTVIRYRKQKKEAQNNAS